MKLRQRGRIRRVGNALLSECGRPVDCYCNFWTPPAQLLRHELMVTDFLLLYPQAQSRRGPNVDKKVRPDAEMDFGGRTYLVELDTGELSHRQVQRRWWQYAAARDYLLVVTTSKDRLQNLIEGAGRIAQIALFSTIQQAIADPLGPIWVDYYGEVTPISP